MLSTIIFIGRAEGRFIPFEYNYYLALSIYNKLSIYQDEIKKLHQKNQPGIHTFSNIITDKVDFGNNGLEIKSGFLILRTIDNRIGSYLRLGVASDPYLKIVNAVYKVKSINDSQGKLNGRNRVNFKTLSPVLVRDFQNKKMFVNNPSLIEENLNMVTKWSLLNQFKLSKSVVDDVKIEIKNSHSKTVRVSSAPKKESITRAFDLAGTISGDPGALEVLYYRGFGSKTGLGLGCWEAI